MLYFIINLPHTTPSFAKLCVKKTLGTYAKKDTLHNRVKVVIMNITESGVFFRRKPKHSIELWSFTRSWTSIITNAK